MDFIERLFGISPDGGSGLFELLMLLVPVLGTLALLAYYLARKRPEAEAKL
jgi:hypothetical protein